MKQLRLLIFALLALLTLVACGGETGVILEAAAEESSGAEEFVPQLDPQRPYSTSDLSLVGNTGRPQFLNSYADW